MITFRMLGIPVGVHVTFLVVALLGASAYRGLDIAIWTLAAFVSILSHEFGHALVARSFGALGLNITLYGLGGLTSYRHGPSMTHGRSFLVSAAGSGVGILIGGSVWLADQQGLFVGASSEVMVFVESVIFTSLVWGILNWVPIVPLDGGHMVLHLVSMFDEERAPLIAQVATWIAVAILAPVAWINGYRFGSLIVIVFAFMGLREYQDTASKRRGHAPSPGAPTESGAHPPIDQAPAAPEPPDFPI
jgi:stage IV sporulation protein FB